MSQGAQQPLHVFLVEDSPIIRERLTESLSTPGRIEVVGHADTEHGAVAALKSTEWDVLVLDLQLKQGTGLGVLKALAGVEARGREGHRAHQLRDPAVPRSQRRAGRRFLLRQVARVLPREERPRGPRREPGRPAPLKSFVAPHSRDAVRWRVPLVPRGHSWHRRTTVRG